MSRLKGKTAVITGGGTGIGLGAAQRFVEEGAFVYLFGRRQEQLDAAVAKLGNSARAVRGSVTDLADLDRLYETVKSERGGLDILFANAGTGAFAPLGAITPEHYDQIFDVNVKGLIFSVQKGLPLMKAGGSIILTGSTTGEMGTAQFSIYSATKAAVRNLARSWALDLKGTGIRVNVLSPGPTRTDLALEVVGKEAFEAIGAMTPLGRIGEPSETGAVAAFLASSDSSFMTSGEVFVDGGLAQI
ncbi:SDR family oxidoreductase [Reyranella sp.]|jgi:NAD(P)-dependent dehydrogenase (short-subunit alcohol dehydrogenase family)|uniref:SDR family NAD(P)-dependent oxidoreductase n=1 Tax=Reyranella sp. TaxID=1929291 RepID=UPI000BD618A4|nr:SDR family oxidoreductase [Reyranella sp.]OYY36245.1 MAG: oxidoreductase [Rhodospirillales bacterium 35-66-84]OYZ91156.1 MAG: oxidoreductase [Rhodospirillales bacterium 24-66-33]OZB22652.1 MAG: oxidoreductase [Rhodospirillales bacterium 39-66-50]HQS18673.1 SDR family oxidoreductase [Reyranella sp.]HQT15203.1 SDR family oxidoreductase [Reyranella sp.]